jgi:large subunit ribosomal protein L1
MARNRIHGKRYKADAEKRDIAKAYPLNEAVAVLKQFKPAKFDMTVNMAIHLGVDVKQADQNLRGSVSLPHGVGKSKKVIAFCPVDKVAAAKEAGAIEAGGEELVKKIEEGWFDFEVAVASPDMMRVVSKLGKVLGPKGLMPSPKAGTVTPDVPTAVREYAAGKVEFRTDAGGNIHVPIGKFSFPAEKLQANAQHMIDHIVRLKPSAAKGQYVKRVSIAGAMTPGVTVAASV